MRILFVTIVLSFFSHSALAQGQLKMLESLQSGVYGVDVAACALDRDNLGDSWGAYFKYISIPDFSVGYETSCTIRNASESRGFLEVNAACNAEGEIQLGYYTWKITSEASFTDISAWDGPQEYILCDSENRQTDTSGVADTMGIGLTIENSGPDLFNIFQYIQAEYCAETQCTYIERAERFCRPFCEYEGVEGTYIAKQIPTEEVLLLLAKSTGQMGFYVQQGIPRGLREDVDPRLISGMEAHRVFRKGCEGEVCESLVVLVQDEFLGYVLDINSDTENPEPRTIEEKAIELTNSMTGPLYVWLQSAFELGSGRSTRQVSGLPSWKMQQMLFQQGNAARNIYQEEALRIAREAEERGTARCDRVRASGGGLCMQLTNTANQYGWHAEFNLTVDTDLVDQENLDTGLSRYNFGPIDTIRILGTRPSTDGTCDIWVKYRVWPIQEEITIVGAAFMQANSKESIDQEVCYRVGRNGLNALVTNMVTE